MSSYEMKTKKGYVFSEVSSAMQKGIRRGDTRLAGFWAIELFESNYYKYVWKRLFTIAAEDCANFATTEIKALWDGFNLVNEGNKGDKTKGRIFIAKAVITLCEWPKSRDADHLTNLVYDRQSGITEPQLLNDLDEARKNNYVPIPDYAFDIHTMKGKFSGKTKKDFFIEEQDALLPKQPGLFDQDLENIRSNKTKI